MMTESDILEALILSLGRSEYAVPELIALAQPFGITGGSVRTWLSRQVGREFLAPRKEGRLAWYRLTERASRISDNISFSFSTPDWSGWDGSWWGCLWSIPGERRQERHRIRTKLSAYRFVTWYDGFWIRPCHDTEPIRDRLEGKGEGDIRLIRFRPERDFSPAEVQELWKIPQTADRLGDGVSLLEKEMSSLTGLSPAEAHVTRIETGNRIVPLIFLDPLLPPSYLPEDWSGPRLRRLFKEWDSSLSQKARPFWDGIFRKG